MEDFSNASEIHLQEILDHLPTHKPTQDEKQDFPAPHPIMRQPGHPPCQISTGTNLILQVQPKDFLQDSLLFEPIGPTKQAALIQSQLHNAQRQANIQNHINKVIFDSVQPTFSRQANWASLNFQSRFQSGNLRRAIQITDFQYDLILNPDLFTKGNTQWYFFSVSNTRPGLQYRFNIINMLKVDSLYNYGMKPLIYSQIQAQTRRRGWIRAGSAICYYQNTIRKKQGGFYYTLTFTITFAHENDTVYFAHCYPYTYSDLTKYLLKITNDPKKRTRCRKKILCKTLAGNDCEILTITSASSDPESLRNRKAVFLMARVHPGQTNASWMMKGVIDYLVGPSLDAKILRDNFVFKVIPMLNPDGVINGAYRCSLAGVDLNRQWIDPSKKLHPTIFNAKACIKQVCQQRDLLLCVDFHGHSRKKNMFMYGCAGRNKLRQRIFPRLLERVSNIFSFSDCVFGLQKAKESTARIVLYKEMGVINSFTLESSFCGADFGPRADFHFNQGDLQQIGRNLCEGVFDFCDPDQIRVRAVLEELEILFPRAVEAENEDEGEAEPQQAKTKKRKRKLKKKIKNVH